VGRELVHRPPAISAPSVDTARTAIGKSYSNRAKLICDIAYAASSNSKQSKISKRLILPSMWRTGR
jgi:hypothetical protein